METFWYWLTQVHLENGRKNGADDRKSKWGNSVIDGHIRSRGADNLKYVIVEFNVPLDTV